MMDRPTAKLYLSLRKVPEEALAMIANLLKNERMAHDPFIVTDLERAISTLLYTLECEQRATMLCEKADKMEEAAAKVQAEADSQIERNQEFERSAREAAYPPFVFPVVIQ